MIFGLRLRKNTRQNMNDIHFSVLAETDILEIAHYTMYKFGTLQSRRYKIGLYNCFQRLAENSNLGRDASEFAPFLKRFSCKSHTIFYRQEEKGVYVVRILNQNLDFGLHL